MLCQKNMLKHLLNHFTDKIIICHDSSKMNKKQQGKTFPMWMPFNKCIRSWEHHCIEAAASINSEICRMTYEILVNERRLSLSPSRSLTLNFSAISLLFNPNEGKMPTQLNWHNVPTQAGGMVLNIRGRNAWIALHFCSWMFCNVCVQCKSINLVAMHILRNDATETTHGFSDWIPALKHPAHSRILPFTDFQNRHGAIPVCVAQL